AIVLKIRDPCAREKRAHRSPDQRTRKYAVQHASAKSRLLGELLVDMQRMAVADQTGSQHQVRIRDRHRGAEGVTDLDLVITFARKNGHRVPCAVGKTNNGRPAAPAPAIPKITRRLPGLPLRFSSA